MARRYHEIKGLAEYTAKVIVSDEQEWKKFLHTAGHMYKYPLREQMLIYAQRPDATACASLELWNEKMNCWVNKGAQGIALIDGEGVHRSGLKYVFDVKDVHEARFIGRKPTLWQMEERHKDYVIDSLEKIYGETDASRSFESRIMELANRIASEMAPDIVSDPGCPNLTDGRVCPEHQKQVNSSYEKYGRDKATKKRYGRAWKRIRDKYAAEHPFCELCFDRGIIVPTEEIHHKRSLSEGGTHDRSNLIALCKSCHSQIHAKRGDYWGGRG